MSFLDAVSWFAVFVVIAVFATGNHKAFAWANVCCFIPIGLPAALAGAYSTASISLAFGLIAGVRLYRRRGQPWEVPVKNLERRSGQDDGLGTVDGWQP